MPIRVLVNGTNIGEVVLKNSPFHVPIALSDSFVGRKQLEIAIEAGRTFRTEKDARELSLAFLSFEIR